MFFVTFSSQKKYLYLARNQSCNQLSTESYGLMAHGNWQCFHMVWKDFVLSISWKTYQTSNNLDIRKAFPLDDNKFSWLDAFSARQTVVWLEYQMNFINST